MTDVDDRQQFAAQGLVDARALGDDAALGKQSRDLLGALDRYRYTYLWSWLGVPIIQMPPDIVLTQEIIWRTKPDVIIETGVARGGSMIFLASMLALIGKGKVLGIDIDVRRHNRESIESHPLAGWITLIEGSSIDPIILKTVATHINQNSSVMVILDSNHSRDHVLKELELYTPLVTKNNFIIVADTGLGFLEPSQTPTERSATWYPGNEPLTALREFLKGNDEFEIDRELNGKAVLSSSIGGYLRRIR